MLFLAKLSSIQLRCLYAFRLPMANEIDAMI
jgi:hypothetical protein